MISVIVIAKNEEANIHACLESVQWAEEVIVLDSGSTDQTMTIAKKFTPHVYQSEDWQGYGIQKQRVLSKASQDWVLNLDADESVTPALADAIQTVIRSEKADAYRIPIQMNFYGKPLQFSSSPQRHIRLFKRKGARFSDDIVHEKILLPDDSRIAKLSIPIQHHSFQDVSHMLYKLNRYSSYSAKIRIENQSMPSFLAILTSTSWMFFRCFFLQRGFMDGRAGFLMSVFNAQGTFYRGIKQLYQDKAIETLPEVKEI